MKKIGKAQKTIIELAYETLYINEKSHLKLKECQKKMFKIFQFFKKGFKYTIMKEIMSQVINITSENYACALD